MMKCRVIYSFEREIVVGTMMLVCDGERRAYGTMSARVLLMLLYKCCR